MPTHEDLILSMLKEIREDQKAIVTQLNDLNKLQNIMKTELEISRNGYTPHEVVELLHWVSDQKIKEEKRNEIIRSAFINWLVPILATSALVGLFVLNK